MRLEVLVSTMHQQGYELIRRMNIQSDAVFINQYDEESIKSINVDDYRIKWINSKKRGLSRSRNMALDNAEADIGLLADDDLEYISDYENIIIEQFKLYPDADIITFQVEGIEREFKNYYHKPRNINFLNSMKVSSVEIAFRLEKIKQVEIDFNNLFGAGAKYYMGEESIFLMDCLRRGLKIRYVPIKIADLHIGESSWFNGYNKEYFVNKGAAFTAMSRKFSLFLIIQFALRKSKLYHRNFTRYQVIKLMIEGKRSFSKEKVVKLQ